MFITFEGLDFSGKTTQAELLVERLENVSTGERKSWQKVHFIREPGGTAISERIRDLLLSKKYHEMSDAAELLLFSASRAQLVAEVIAPSLRRGEIVVCDRYYDSTTAYQAYGRGLQLDMVKNINRFATTQVDPDLTLFVDITVEEIQRRKASEGIAFDRMESSGKEFYERVRAGYVEIVRQESRCVRVDGMKPIEEIAAGIWKVVNQTLIIRSSTMEKNRQ